MTSLSSDGLVSEDSNSNPPGGGDMPSSSAEWMLQSDSGSQCEEDQEGAFYFESDHVALKANPDYQQLLRTVALLEAQRIQAIQDLDRLADCQREALDNPIAFVGRLQGGEDGGIPPPIRVAQLPDIQWDRYSTGLENTAAHAKHMTRNKRSVPESETPPPHMPVNPDSKIVRGRLKDQSKPATFNQLWTTEEQKRLEDLLIQFPPEEVEARRWEKIATALGNRTLQQVASRVQKYFIKLAKAGLPIPGRLPNLSQYARRSGVHRHQRNNRFYFQSSTFMTSYEPPVFMSDDDDMSSQAYSSEGGIPMSQPRELDVSDEEDVPFEMRDTMDYLELLRLKQIKQQRLQDEGVHIGYKCDSCGIEPIIGTRWHCVECPPEESVDFCPMCADSTVETTTHQSHHQLEPIQPVQVQQNATAYDSDYTRLTEGRHSYLDPNFMPV